MLFRADQRGDGKVLNRHPHEGPVAAEHGWRYRWREVGRGERSNRYPAVPAKTAERVSLWRPSNSTETEGSAEMKMPGFTAEASFYAATHQYHGKGHSAASNGGVVLPQIRLGSTGTTTITFFPGGQCWQTCRGGSCDSGYCCISGLCGPIAFSDF
jgi:hypothetical protein